MPTYGCLDGGSSMQVLSLKVLKHSKDVIRLGPSVVEDQQQEAVNQEGPLS